MGVTLRFPPDPLIYRTFTCLRAVHVARCACFRHLPVAQASRRFRVFVSSIPSPSVLRFLLQCPWRHFRPACGLGAPPHRAGRLFPLDPGGAPRGAHWAPRMVAFLSRSFLKVLFSLVVQFMACSLQHSAADIGAGAWVGEGITDFAAFVAEPIDPTRPPSSGFFVPAFQHSRQAFSSNSAADVGADCSIGEGSICSASSRSNSTALLRLRLSSVLAFQDDHFLRSPFSVPPFFFNIHCAYLHCASASAACCLSP